MTCPNGSVALADGGSWKCAELGEGLSLQDGSLDLSPMRMDRPYFRQDPHTIYVAATGTAIENGRNFLAALDSIDPRERITIRIGPGDFEFGSRLPATGSDLTIVPAGVSIQGGGTVASRASLAFPVGGSACVGRLR
jgi:hypothetical protein